MAKELKLKEVTKFPERAKSETLSRWETDIERLFDKMYEDFWRAFPRRWAGETWPFRMALHAPALDLYEEGDELVVKGELPGIDAQDLDIELTGTTLTIKGEKKREHEAKEEKYYRSERSYGSFTRTVELPYEVHSDNIKASLKSGVLEIRLHKTEEAKKNTVKVKLET